MLQFPKTVFFSVFGLIKKEQQHPKEQEIVEQMLYDAGITLNYVPARISLAAYYTYYCQPSRCREAIELLQSYNSNHTTTTKNDLFHLYITKPIEHILYDAQIILAGQYHMVQSILRIDEYVSIHYSKDCSKLLVPPMMMPPSPTTTETFSNNNHSTTTTTNDTKKNN